MAERTSFLQVVSRDEAQRRFEDVLCLQPLGPELIPLCEGLGRVMATAVRARVNVPSFDRSNFDGFAIKAADLIGAGEDRPCRLFRVPGHVETGQIPTLHVESRHAAAISTGGMIPRGANAVVLIEDCEVGEQEVLVRRSVASGHGISTAGSDIAIGETVLPQGTLLTSRETGVLAAIGESQVEVWRRPRVAVISTGNEVIPPGQPMRPALVFDSNARIIADSVRECGGQPIELGIAVDQEAQLTDLLNTGLELADVVVMSGGTSKGDGDLCYRVVAELRDPGIVVHGVSLKPGKPVCLAASRGKPVVVLPGFPTSAIFTFHEFVRPVIQRLAGRVGTQSAEVEARLPHRIRSEVGRTEYVLVGLVPGSGTEGEEALPIAYPMGKGSGSVTTYSRADGFIRLAQETELVPQGTHVRVQLFAKQLEPADLIVMGSHCLGLDWLLERLQQRGIRIKFFAVGSEAGLEAAHQGRCDVAGIHLFDPETGTYNKTMIDRDRVQLQRGYSREQGIIFPRSKTAEFGTSLEQASRFVRSAAGCRMVNRNQGSGTRNHIDRLLQGARPDGYSYQVHHHTAVAAAVEQHRADWGVAIRQVCNQQSCGFIPLTTEQFDFAIPHTRSKRKPVREFLEILAESATAHELAELGFLVG